MTLIKTPKNPIALNEIIASLVIKQIDSNHVYSFRSGEIHFESVEEIPWTLDGEFGGEHDEVTILNKKQGLLIMVAEDTKARLEVKKEELLEKIKEEEGLEI